MRTAVLRTTFYRSATFSICSKKTGEGDHGGFAIVQEALSLRRQGRHRESHLNPHLSFVNPDFDLPGSVHDIDAHILLVPLDMKVG